MTKHAAVAIVALAVAGWAAPALAAGNPGEGEKVFKRVCTSCHIPTAEGPKRLGPTLFGVIGRKSGAVEGFRYSEANKNANIVWSVENLDPYLTDPKKVIPGTIMAFAGVKKPDERADLIAYLATLK
jgi:cytochrome c